MYARLLLLALVLVATGCSTKDGKPCLACNCTSETLESQARRYLGMDPVPDAESGQQPAPALR